MYQSSIPESSSILDLSPRSQVNRQGFNFQPPITTSLDFEIHANQWQQKQQKEPVYESSRVLVFKGIPEDVMESEILGLCKYFGPVKDMLVKSQKKYAFVQFERIEQAQKCFESFTKLPPLIRGNPLYVGYTGKDTLNSSESLNNQPTRFLVLDFNLPELKIDSNIVMQLLAPYGCCLKVAIFQGQTTQAVVEMEDLRQAMRVRACLDGQMVFNMTCLRVSYTEEKELFRQVQVYPEEKEFYRHQVKANTMVYANVSTAGTLESLPQQHHYAHSSNKSFTHIWNDHKESSSCVWPNTFEMKKMGNAPMNMPVYHTEPLLRPPSLNQEKQFQSPKPQTANMVSSLIHAKEPKSDTILLLRNLPQGLTAKMLFRLFGMYGNVLKVKIFFKNPENALVEFQTPEQAEIAKSYLNNCSVYGNNMFVTNSRQGVFIDTSSLKKGEETQYVGDYTNSPEHRYKFSGSKNHLNIVPPSKVLHLSNLWEDKEEDFYFELFKDFGIVKKFTFLKGPERMALMEMNSIDETVKVLMNFHNFNINGKYLKVSFSKYQKIKDF